MSARRALVSTGVFALIALAAAPFAGGALDGESSRFILFDIRIPRVLMGFFCGAGLAVAGVVLQAILRNPLATPYTLGVASGAAFGVVLAIVLGIDLAVYRLLGRPVVGMAGATLVIFLAYRTARVRGRLPSHTLLLAGVALTFLFSSLILAIQYTATPDHAIRILRWLVGSLEAGLGYGPPSIVGGCVAFGIAMLLPLGRAFNALSAGEEAALGVGVDVERVVVRGYLVSSLMVGAIVAFVGPIGFVGLVVPHALRLIGVVDNRILLPAAALAGGGFLVTCDAATVLWERRFPVGVLTPMLGGPFFLALLLRRKAG
ncbi:MAG: iron ABC transporter permease [Planctomycetota bacterium]|nr:iron ABC transporter permease [Planctomycetota bacterium]